MNIISDHQKHFAKLSDEVNNLLKLFPWHKVYGIELLKFSARVALFVLGFFIFSQQVWWSYILGLTCMAYAHGGIAISGIHEARHQSFVKSYWGNRIWAYFFSDFWVGQSNEWWHDTHVLIHHPNTNIPSIDPPSFYFPWLNRYIYFFIIPWFAIIWLNIMSTVYLWTKWFKLALFLVTATLGWLFHIWLFTLIVPLPYALLCTYLVRTLFAPIFVHLAVFNHVGLPTPEKRLAWLPHQLLTTRNIKKNWFLTGLGGNAFVECHTEHHIFPNISNHLLNRIRPIVEKYAQKYGYQYLEESYLTVLKNAIDQYDQMFTLQPQLVNDHGFPVE